MKRLFSAFLVVGFLVVPLKAALVGSSTVGSSTSGNLINGGLIGVNDGGSSGPASSLLTGLVSYWTMNESGTGTRADSTTNAQTLTSNNSTASTTGLISNAVLFVSSNTNTLSRTMSAGPLEVVSGDDYTWCGWLKPTTIPDLSDYFVSWGGSGTDPQNSFEAYTIKTSSEVLCQTGNGTSVTTAQITTAHLSSTSWSLVCLRWTNATTTLTCSVNDPTVAANKATNAAAHTFATNGTAVMGSFGVAGAAGFNYNGAMDEVGFWQTASGGGGTLTDTQIKNLYNGGAGVTYPFTGVP